MSKADKVRIVEKVLRKIRLVSALVRREKNV
jgi:hypothetical protein